MAVTQDNTASDARQLRYLRDILAVVAEQHTLETSVARLLDLAIDATGATGGRVLLFVEPRLSVSAGSGKTWNVADDRLSQALGDLLPGLPPEPVSFGRNGRRAQTPIVAPVADDRVVGGLVLLIKGGLSPDVTDIMTDVTNALRVCVGRARSERRSAHVPILARALHVLEDPILLLDADYGVLAINQAAETAFGIAQDQAEGQAAVTLPGLRPLADALVSGEMPSEWMREGSDKVYAPRLVALDTASERSFAWVFRDMTHYKQLERNHAEFIHIVSHDLRSPLTSMLLYVNVLEDLLAGAEDADKQAALQKIERGLHVLTGHVDNIQDAGRYDPETGFYKMSRQPVDIREVARRIVDNQLIAPQKRLSLTVDIADDLPLVNVDAYMIERATINLVDNAIKYTPAGGSVALIVRHDAERVCVGVRDTGLGISLDDQKLLFRRHVRLRRREHQKIKGTGLGLFIVRSVAQRHGGDAWVESREGEGSTFWFSIPLTGENVLVPQL